MEDDEEIQSHASEANGSPSPSPQNGRITVTVAAATAAPSSQPPPATLINSKNNSLALVLPVQQQAKINGGGREDCWSEGATAVLIDAWGERYAELSRGNLKQKHWKEVADIVSSREDYTKPAKTDIQCKNRIDTVKKKYKSEKTKIVAGGGRSKWPFFQRLERLIGPTAKIPAVSTTATDGVIAANKVIPVGIPVGIGNQFQFGKSQMKGVLGVKNQNVKGVLRKRSSQAETESDDDDNEEGEGNFVDSDDSLPLGKKRKEMVAVEKGGNGKVAVGKERKGWGNSIRMLTQAILKFGEAYEQAESVKLQQVVEMEKTRMKFAKEMELQRMQFFMKTQMEISQLKRGTRGNGSSNHHHSGNNNISQNNKTNNNK